MKRMNLLFRPSRLGLFALMLWQSPSSVAQDAAESGEVYELSPFSVKVEEGWTATETLAGSRLRTNYKDVATQLETMTMDFMDDFNLNSPEEASIYSLNVENVSEHNEAASISTGIQTSLTGALRIRGLAAATNSREFFGLIAPSDNYNIDRIDIASGPNSILFGTGSPAGVINSSLKRAVFRDSGNVRVEFDSNGSERYQFDVNRVLIEDKLALRFAALNWNKKFDQEPANEYAKRYYGSLTYRPFEKTSITVSYEDVSIDSHRPSRVFLFDNLTPWFEADSYQRHSSQPAGLGYPSQYIFPNSLEWQTGQDLNGDGRVDGHLNEPIPDSGSFSPRSFATGQNVFNVDNTEPTIIVNNGQEIGFSSMNGLVDVKSLSSIDGDPVNSTPNGLTLVDDRYFPSSSINTLYDGRFKNDSSEIFNAFVNQTIAENLFFEFAVQTENYDSFNSQALSYLDAANIRIDPNMYLADGITPNPNAGEFFMEGSAQYNRGYTKTEDWRAALSYEFDIADKTDGFFKHFGKHRMAVLKSFNERQNNGQEFQYQIQPRLNSDGTFTDPVIPNRVAEGPLKGVGGGWLNNGDRRLRTRVYIDPADPGAARMSQRVGDPWQFTDANGEPWVVDAEFAMNAADGTPLVPGRSNPVTFKATKADTEQFSHQGFFWKNRIITTFGYREDVVNATENLDRRDTLLLPITDPRDGEPANAWDWGLRPYYTSNTLLPYGTANEEKGITKTKGIVIHPLQDLVELPLGATLSFSYNESDTFQPAIAGSLIVNGQNLRGTSGSGEDKGIRLGLLDGRLSINYNKFENNATPFSISLPFRRYRFAFQNFFRSLDDGLSPGLYERPDWPTATWEGANLDKAYPRGAGSNWADPYVATSDNVAKGDEIQIAWKINDGWDLRFNYSKQESIQSNITTDWIRFGEELFPYMDGLGAIFPEDFDNTGRDMNADGDTTDMFTWDQIPLGEINANGSISGNRNRPFRGPDVEDGKWLWGDLGENILSMREYTYAQAYVNGGAPIPLLQAYDGKPNDFTRENRWNLNTSYTFREGRLKGFRVGAGYRFREAPTVGFEGKTVAGKQVPDVDKPIFGSVQKYLDLSAGYRGTASWLGNRNYRINLTMFNALDDDTSVATVVRTTGEGMVFARQDGRRTSISFDLEF